MTPERWEKVDRVWHAVLAHPEHERASKMGELCAGDESLRRDVESLLADRALASAAGFGTPGAGVMAASDSLIGRQLGPYAVQALLGVGGMGEVYRAHDTTLGREVAIKILPGPWMADAARLARFDREARLLASLNHPNIGAIYGVHEADDVRALVLELVEGETLAERIARSKTEASDQRRGMAADDVVTIARQIIDALAAAHDRGIIHRDLKPANIKVTPEMRVKVLDFGLARAISAADPDRDPAHSLTITIGGTHEGVLLGTAPYMSPEQARGKAVDKRADIWAFGCVLYEMLTGARAFGGDAAADVLANVIKEEPDWNALPAATPAAMRVCLQRCLRKDPQDRIHDIADVRLAMEGAFESLQPAKSRPRRAPYVGWVVAAIVTVAAAIVVVPLLRRAADVALSPQTATPPVLVSPRASGGGSATARTIQEGIDMVARGGTVSMLPGTYAEALRITKGLTLTGTGQRSGPVVVAPPGAPESVIEIATSEPVTLRGFVIHVPGAHGIRGLGAVDLTVELTTMLAVNQPFGQGSLILISNDASSTGARARAAIRRSSFDGTVTKLRPGEPRPQTHALRLAGDLDGVIEGNIIRRTGAICVMVATRDDLGGHTNVDILDNDVDECHPVARVGAIVVGTPTVQLLSRERPVTATGSVNIVGNTIRNSSEECLVNAIGYDVFSGRIERNRILNVVQPCAAPTPRNLPSAIWIGVRTTGVVFPPAVPRVRFNDVQGNAHAGLRIAANQTIAIDASCNYWGSARGPSGVGVGDGDSILVEPGAPLPRFTPFAPAPVARTSATGC